MPVLTIQEILNPPTADQVRAQWVAQLFNLGVPADKWRKGSVAGTILTILSATFATFGNLLVQGVSGAFLGTPTAPLAQGPWLTLLAFYVYGVTRISATFATGTVTLTNNQGGLYPLSPGDLVVQNNTTFATYRNTTAFTVLPGPGFSITVPVQADLAGSAFGSAPGFITNMVTQLLGVTVTNNFALSGLDEQTDPSLVQSCLDSLGIRSVRGVLSAYRYAVMSALNGGNPVNINRVSVSNNGAGVLTITCAAPSGVPTPGDLAAAQTNVNNVARPQGVTANVVAVIPVPYTTTLFVYAKDSPNSNSDLVNLIDTALNSYFSTFPIGGLPKGSVSGIWASGVIDVAGSVDSTIYAIDGAIDLNLLPSQAATDGITVVVVTS